MTHKWTAWIEDPSGACHPTIDEFMYSVSGGAYRSDIIIARGSATPTPTTTAIPNGATIHSAPTIPTTHNPDDLTVVAPDVWISHENITYVRQILQDAQRRADELNRQPAP